jgi:calcineurin-like phosphoesterase family protein
MTANYYFTADTHFGHADIIHHTYRPFTDVDYMDEKLIENWNNTVTPQDVVVHLGDFTLEPKVIARQYRERLHGNIIFIKGNHDHWITKEKRYEYHKKVGVNHVYGTHFPLRTWPKSFANGVNLHGHCHAQLAPHWFNQLDCGVDNAFRLVGEYRPLSYGEVMSAIDEQNEAWMITNKKLYDKIVMNGKHERTSEMIGAVK